MERRSFLAAALAFAAVPLAAEAQPARQVYRLGFLSPAGRPSPSDPTTTNRLLFMPLHQLGYVEGQNLVVERRFAEGKIDRLSALARELVELRVDVIVASSGGAVQAAKEATKTVPIVMGFSSDPVGRGFVASPVLNLDRKRLHELAAKHRLPAIYDWRENAEEGGLMAYGGNIAALFRRVAEYVDKILKGAKPADLPVEQPTTFELVINMRTAKALGLTIPPSLLLRADQVIE